MTNNQRQPSSVVAGFYGDENRSGQQLTYTMPYVFSFTCIKHQNTLALLQILTEWKTCGF